MRTWSEIFKEIISPEFKKIIDEEYATKEIFPPKKELFSAFSLTPFEKVRVVFLSQDPYHTPGFAHGLAFSVSPTVRPLPKSLQNLLKELQNDLSIPISTSGSLIPWAKQGVLLINSSLTVEAGKAGSHSEIGWKPITRKIIEILSVEHDKIVFVLLGNHAASFLNYIDKEKHIIIQAVHPSPLSAHKGFFGSKIFSRINENLDEPIDWNLEKKELEYNIPWHSYF